MESETHSYTLVVNIRVLNIENPGRRLQQAALEEVLQKMAQDDEG